MQPVIALDHVSKRFGHQDALNDISFSVPPGTVFALLGENGAGKTTLIRVLLGLLHADEGSSGVLGLDSRTDGLAIRRSVGYVSERPSLDEWMRVRDVGWYAAGFYGHGFLDRFLRQVDCFGVDVNRRVKQLSKGMRSKVSLSLALAHDPQLLILDEPTSGLDALVRREFLESMVDFTSDGRTVFLSSHQIHEVERVADIVAILRSGEILVCEPIDELKQNVTVATVTIQGDGVIEAPPGVFFYDQRHRQLEMFLRASEAEAAEALHPWSRVERFDLRRPSLEEIFVAYMKSTSPNSTTAAVGQGAIR